MTTQPYIVSQIQKRLGLTFEDASALYSQAQAVIPISGSIIGDGERTFWENRQNDSSTTANSLFFINLVQSGLYLFDVTCSASNAVDCTIQIVNRPGVVATTLFRMPLGSSVDHIFWSEVIRATADGGNAAQFQIQFVNGAGVAVYALSRWRVITTF